MRKRRPTVDLRKHRVMKMLLIVHGNARHAVHGVQPSYLARPFTSRSHSTSVSRMVIHVLSMTSGVA